MDNMTKQLLVDFCREAFFRLVGPGRWALYSESAPQFDPKKYKESDFLDVEEGDTVFLWDEDESEVEQAKVVLKRDGVPYIAQQNGTEWVLAPCWASCCFKDIKSLTESEEFQSDLNFYTPRYQRIKTIKDSV